MIREFNFVIGQELHDKIKDYSEKRNISYNNAVIIIFNIMIPLLKKEHFTGVERKNKYQRITAVKRVHLYLDIKIHREIKLIHSNLDFFSMAILVRFLIEEFFKRLEKNKNNEEKVKKAMEKMKEKFNKNGGWEKVRKGQLCEIYLQISYNEKYNIKKIELYT